MSIKNRFYIFVLICCFSSCKNQGLDLNNGMVNIQKIIEAQNLNTPKDGEALKQSIFKKLYFQKNMVSKAGRPAEPDKTIEEKSQIENELLNSRESQQNGI